MNLQQIIARVEGFTIFDYDHRRVIPRRFRQAYERHRKKMNKTIRAREATLAQQKRWDEIALRGPTRFSRDNLRTDGNFFSMMGALFLSQKQKRKQSAYADRRKKR